jgi:uncharacterized phage protein (TIGR02218 family)
MSRTLTAANEAMIATRNHHRAICVRIETRVGEVLSFTDHDEELTFTLADVAADYDETYSPQTGMIASEIVLASGLNTDSCELTLPISASIRAAQVLGKKFNGARCWIFDVDWRDPDAGQIRYIGGTIAESRLEGRKAILEVRNQFDAFNQSIGRVLSPYCTADFGDGQCGKTRTAYATTILAVDDDFNFTVNLAGVHPDDFFNLGVIAFGSGELAGIAEIEIFDYVGASGLVQLFVPCPQAPEVGDAVTLYRGCSKLKSSEDASLPTCLSYGNVLNFRGFDRVPGSDNYLKVPVPGAPGA